MKETKVPVVFAYEGSNITFFKGESVMVNATEMAKPFGKRPVDWLQNQQTKDFLMELSKVRKSTLADLVRVTKGGNNPGTWMHEDVALEFARWLAPKFAIWCNDRIKELLMKGSTSIIGGATDTANILPTDKPWVRAMKHIKAANDELLWMQDQLDQARGAMELNRKLVEDSEDVRYAKSVLKSTTTWNTNVIAKEFGLSAKTLNKKLEAMGVQYKQHGVWLLSADYQDKGYAKTQTYNYLNRDGEACTRLQTEWTEKGRRFLHKLHDEKKF